MQNLVQNIAAGSFCAESETEVSVSLLANFSSVLMKITNNGSYLD